MKKGEQQISQRQQRLRQCWALNSSVNSAPVHEPKIHIRAQWPWNSSEQHCSSGLTLGTQGPPPSPRWVGTNARDPAPR